MLNTQDGNVCFSFNFFFYGKYTVTLDGSLYTKFRLGIRYQTETV